MRWLVYDVGEKTRLDILRLLYLLVSSHKVPDSTKKKVRLNEIGMESVTTLLSKQDVSREIIIALLKLGLSFDRNAQKEMDIYTHCDIVIAILAVLQVQPLPVKLEVTLKVRNKVFSVGGSVALQKRAKAHL